MRIYLAGKMRGIPQFNFPAFHAAAKILRGMGHEVFSPAEADERDGFDPTKDEAKDIKQYMIHDLPAVCRSDAVVVLPGWETSQGATTEVYVAKAMGMAVYEIEPQMQGRSHFLKSVAVAWKKPTVATTIPVGLEPAVLPDPLSDRCTCNCATKCPLGRTGIANRCTADELRDELLKRDAVKGPPEKCECDCPPAHLALKTCSCGYNYWGNWCPKCATHLQDQPPKATAHYAPYGPADGRYPCGAKVAQTTVCTGAPSLVTCDACKKLPSFLANSASSGSLKVCQSCHKSFTWNYRCCPYCGVEWTHGVTPSGQKLGTPGIATDNSLDAQKVSTCAGEVRVTDEKTGGQKGQKEQRYDLLPWDVLDEDAKLYGRGAAKYAARNWERGYSWSLSFAACLRHLTAFWQRRESIDPENGCHHLAAARFHLAALMRFDRAFPEGDERPK